MANFEAKVTAKGQITLPAKLRAKLGVGPGDVVSFKESGDGGFRIENLGRPDGHHESGAFVHFNGLREMARGSARARVASGGARGRKIVSETAMLGIGANILSRCLVDTNLWPADSARQLAAAQRLLSDKKQKFYVNSIVLAESLWLLERRLKQPPTMIVRVLEGLLGASNVAVQDREAVADALAAHARSRPGMNDRLIAFVNLHACCEATLTSGAAAAVTRGFRLLPAI